MTSDDQTRSAATAPRFSRFLKGFELRAFGIGIALSFGWRWRWLLRRDEGLKFCVFGVLLEVGRWPRG